MQYTKLLRCIEENPDDFAAALQGLGVPPDVHRMAPTHPECKHLATLPPDLLWKGYLRERCLGLQREAVRTARDAAEREANQTLPKSEVSKLWRRIRAVVPIVYLMCTLKAAQMGTTSTQQVEETQAAFAQGSIFTEYLSCATSHSEVLQQCLGNYTIRSTWKTETLDV